MPSDTEVQKRAPESYADKYAKRGEIVGASLGFGVGILASFAAAKAVVTGVGLGFLATTAASLVLPLALAAMATGAFFILHSLFSKKSSFWDGSLTLTGGSLVSLFVGNAAGIEPGSGLVATVASGATAKGVEIFTAGSPSAALGVTWVCAMGGRGVGHAVGWVVGKTRDLLAPQP